MEKSYFLFKHNYERAIEGYRRLQSIPIVPVSNSNTVERNNIIVLNLHGECSKGNIVPHNITLCFLTPAKYTTCTHTPSFIEYLTKPNVIENFLKDPSCLDKEKIVLFF